MKLAAILARSLPIFVATGLLLTASLSFAQGEVDFENFSNSLIYTNSVHNGPATGLMSGPVGSYEFALLAAFTNTTTIDATLGGGRALDNGGWDVAYLYGYNTATPGLMNGNDLQSGPAAGPLAGWPSGDLANFAVVGWSANIGTSWGDALAWWNNGNPNSGPSGYFAISGIAQDVVVGGNPYPIPTIFGPTPGYEIQGFTLNLYTIPEPSTLLLAGFGVASLLALRRRKS
jgi:hypothetical protein